ncbi:PilZ domain-containing protein [Kaarinaea lacus]
MMNNLFEKLSVLLTGDLETTMFDVEHSDNAGDRRWANRSALKLRVNLYRNGSIVRNSIAKDFSLNGMFLRCHNADLQVGDELALAIPEESDGAEKWYPMQVKVTRVADSGVGMTFCQHNSQSFSCICKMLRFQCDQKAASRLSEGSGAHEAA